MNDIKIGDYVECVESNPDYNNTFTEGRKYPVVGVSDGCYLITDNDGEHCSVYMPLRGSFWTFKKAES